MTVLGAIFLPTFPPEQLTTVARAADDSGLEELWLWEDCFQQGSIAAASAALASTSRLRVGIGVIPVPLRNVAITAMELATVLRMFPGRLEVGLGHGVQSWMAQVGARPLSPLTLMREQIAALRALLEGQEVTMDGRNVALDRVRLDWPPTAVPSLLVGVTGPKSLQLSGEVADGTILTASTTRESFADAQRSIAEGQSRVSPQRPHSITVYVRVATGEGCAERIAAAAQVDGAAGVAGDAEVIAAEVKGWAEAGADRVVLEPTADEPDPEAFVRFVAEQVRPLVA